MNAAELDAMLKAIGWTARELADRLGIRRDTAYSWLTGRRPVPDNVAAWLIKVRKALATVPPLPEEWRS